MTPPKTPMEEKMPNIADAYEQGVEHARKEAEEKQIGFKECLKVKVLTDWKGQNEFIDYIDKKFKEVFGGKE